LFIITNRTKKVKFDLSRPNSGFLYLNKGGLETYEISQIFLKNDRDPGLEKQWSEGIFIFSGLVGY